MVEHAEANAEFVAEEVVGDCAYGDGETRKAFAEAGRKLVAKVANRRGGAQFPKEDFRIDLETMSCTCPAGHETRKVVSISSGDRYGAPGSPLRAFRFEAAVCDVCPLRPSCMRARLGKGRLVMIHPQEDLLQEARAFQQSEAFAPYRKLRQAAEHRLARLVQLGAPGPLLRSNQDAFPAPYGRHRRQSHARGDEGRPHARPQPPQDGQLHTQPCPDRDLWLVYGSIL
jgi:hypothetical protein